MGNLVFQATLGGQVNLVGPNTASTFNINVPATTGTMVTTGDTGTVTNTMLATSAYTAPGTIGSGTPNSGAFTTLSASSTVSGTGFSTYLASPPAIGGTAAAAVSSTALSYTTTLTGGTGIVNLGSGQFYKDASGNVGIGTSSPAYKLDVSGALAVRSGNVSYLFNSDNTNSYYTYNAGATGAANAAMVFGQTGQGERMRIDSSGNLLVGTITSPSGSGNIQAPSIYTNTTASVSYVAVSSSGLLQRGGVSALKYKQDVRDLESIDINKFRSVRYKSKCENDDQTKDHFGFIADEVAAQGLTELVTYGEDGDIEGFQYERMCVVLLKNAQEQQATIADMETKLKAADVAGF